MVMPFALHRSSLPRDSLVLALVLSAPILAFVVLRLWPALDVEYNSVLFHLLIVSGLSACALVVAVLAAVAAGRTGHRSLTLLGAACLTVGVFMLGHGLATPGIADRPMNMWVGRFPVFALAGFATFLAAALRRPSDRRGLVDRHPRAFLAGYATVVTVGVGAAVLWPAAGPGHMMMHGESDLGDVVLLLSGLAMLATGWGDLRRRRLGRDRVQFALVLACWLGVEALVSLRFGTLWHLSWWGYHAVLLAGFGSAVFAIGTEYRRVRLHRRDPRRRRPARRHGAHHPRLPRGATRARRRGRARGQAHPRTLGPRRGVVGPTRSADGPRPDTAARAGTRRGAARHRQDRHADAVLNKPGALTPQERVWIEQQPAAGW